MWLRKTVDPVLKSFNDFLIVQGNKIKNMKTNQLKRKQQEKSDEEEECRNDEDKDPQLPQKKHAFDDHLTKKEKNLLYPYGIKENTTTPMVK